MLRNFSPPCAVKAARASSKGVVVAVMATVVFAAGLDAVAVVVVAAGLAVVFSCAEETLANALKERAQSTALMIGLFFMTIYPFAAREVRLLRK
jgi:hypothetical protein